MMPKRLRTPARGVPAYDPPMPTSEGIDPVQAMMALQSEIDEFRYVVKEVLAPPFQEFREECEQFSETRLAVKMLEQYVNGSAERSE